MDSSGSADEKIKRDYLSRVNIAAVVNNKIISTRDISDRIKFIGFMSSIGLKVMSSKQFKRQVLEQLIDEELERQEIKRLQIKISPPRLGGETLTFGNAEVDIQCTNSSELF